MNPLSVASNRELNQFFRAAGLSFDSLGTAYGGFEVWCVRTGGEKNPPILITAGSHADELGGVYGALALAESLETDHRTYIIPVRDPFGFEGYRANLQFALERRAEITTIESVYSVLRDRGEVLYERESYVLSRIGPLVFAFDRGTDFQTSSVGRTLEEIIGAQPELLPTLSAAERVVAPWNLPMPRFGDPFQQAARGMIVLPDGDVGNFNRFFDSPDPPAEVRIVREFVDHVRPGFVLDLHEGYGRGFYVYKPETGEDPQNETIAHSMGHAVAARGGLTATPEELLPYWGPELAKGREYFGNGVFFPGPTTSGSFGSYCWQRSRAFTLETGALNPAGWRANLHTWAATAAVAAWEETL